MLPTTDTLLGPNPPHSAYSESFRVLRANILARYGQEPFSSIMITSALAREGKTTVALNLATVLGLARKQVILVDADMYQEALGRALGISGTPGLTDLCQGATSVEEILQPTEIPTLRLVSAGTQTEAASELVVSPSMTEAVRDLTGQAEFVIFDTTPAIGFGPALSLASLMDLVIVVARARGDARPVQQALAALTDVGGKIGGVIVNDILPQDSLATGSYYRYYYPRE